MKKFLIGCGVVVLLAVVAAVAVLVVYGPKAMQWGRGMVEKAKDGLVKEEARMRALSAWQGPPADTPAAEVFPERVGEWNREVVQDGALLRALGVTRPARQATYHGPAGKVEVWAFPVNDLEKDGLLAQIRDAYERSSGMKSTTSLPSRSSFSGTAIGVNHVFSPSGWLFIFREVDTVDPFPLIDAFFEAAAAPALPPAGASGP